MASATQLNTGITKLEPPVYVISGLLPRMDIHMPLAWNQRGAGMTHVRTLTIQETMMNALKAVDTLCHLRAWNGPPPAIGNILILLRQSNLSSYFRLLRHPR
jgi:hypothetical protein